MVEVQSPKIIAVIAMHGRQSTVQRCIDLMPWIEKIYVYSNDSDGQFLKRNGMEAYKFENFPLSKKWNFAMSLLKGRDFDGVILLGSDDYVDKAFLKYVSEKVRQFDLVSFTDIYFESEEGQYYWRGYTNHRDGEPAGAGKTYSRKFLERINYDLFPGTSNRGLDGISWKVCHSADANILVSSLLENDLYLCDIKDGEGMTPLSTIPGLIKIK